MAESFDLVLVDLQMPEVDGYNLTKQLYKTIDRFLQADKENE